MSFHKAEEKLTEQELKANKKERNRLYYLAHKDSASEYHKNKKFPIDKTKKRADEIKRKYGISSDDLNAIFVSQEGRCAICHREFPKHKSPCVDHDHITGKVRGLLCDYCNVGLGRFFDNVDYLRRAIIYLEN